MRCPDKVTALHSLTQRVAFVHAMHCVFSLTTHLSVMLNLFQHLSAVIVIILARGGILKQVQDDL